MTSTTGAAEVGHHIGGAQVEAHGGGTFESRNPAHLDDVVGRFARGDAEDVDRAVRVAQQAWPQWRGTPWPARGEIVLAAAELLERRKEDLARLMTREMGKVIAEARGDVQEAIDMGKFVAGEGRRAFGETVPSELRQRWAMTMRQPFGVVGCITPWNFPMAIPSWKIFPALMAGNAVVLKPAEDTPLCALRFAEVLEEAGLPAGVLNVVFGFGEEAGAALVRHPGVRAIFFTGSVATGRAVAEACGRLLKKCSLELGGKNAIVVLGDADLELAVDGALWGAFGTSGQRCTASSRLIIERPVLDAFTERLLERTAQLRLGDGLDEQVDVGPVVNERQLRRIHEYTEVGIAEGAQRAIGGEIARAGALAEGCYYTPTVPPPPWTMLTTPLGMPASARSSTNRCASAGVSVAGFRTTVFPQTSAGMSFHDGIATGKFHGVIAPTTPIGWRMLMFHLSRSSEGVVWPKRRLPSPAM